MFAIDVFVPKFSNEIKTFSEKLIDRMECKSVEGIVTERTLSQIESSTSAQEIWIASNDLNTELEGYIGDYVDVVQANLERGIIYRIFYPKGGHANAMRVAWILGKT